MTPQRSTRRTASRGRAWKIVSALAATSLGLLAVTFVALGSPFPRPWFVFVGSAAILLVAVLGAASATSRTAPATFGLIAFLTGLFLRFTAFSRVLYSGLDHGRWMSYADRIIQTGGIVGSDMYTASPLYILELVVAEGIIDGPIHTVRFFTIVVAALLPVFVGVLAYRITDDVRVGYVALGLAAVGPLYFRTAALLESESLAITWFVLAAYLFLRSIRSRNRQYYGLFLLVAGSAIILHFFYGLLLFLTLSITYAALLTGRALGSARSVPDPPANLGFGVVAVGVVTASWMLWSVYAHTAVVTLESAATLSLSPDVAGIFLPSEGIVGESVGAGGGGGPAVQLLRLAPIAIISVLAAVGAFYTLRGWSRDHFGEIIAGTTIILALALGISTPDYDLAFRTYYFVLVFVIIFAAVAVVIGLRGSTGWRRYAVVSVLAVSLFSYALLAPVTPLGNNVDPRFGGTEWAVTKTEHAQLEQLDDRFTGDEHIDSKIHQIHPFLLPRVADDDLVLTDGSCGSNATISDTGGFSVCRDRGD